MRTFNTASAPHLPAQRSVRGVMAWVLAALLPGVIAHAWFFGPGIVIQISLATAFALGFEAGMLRLRGKPLRLFLTDLSAPLTAVLFALSIPPLSPWWLSAIGMASAIVVAKHLYGGLGHNLFNPAMVGVAVVLLCFPREFTQWLPPYGMPGGVALPDLEASLRAVLTGELPPPWRWDAVAQATPLDAMRSLGRAGNSLDEIRRDPAFGTLAGRGWEWVSACFALGGLLLVWKKRIPWQVPAATLGTIALVTLPYWLSDPDLHPSPLMHALSGGSVLCAFFIATDPVSGCTTPRGRLLFGMGVAIITLAIRRWGAFPDGVAFAVLLMNSAAPWLDRYTRPRILGENPAP